jgi:hypothetical protein
MNWLIEDNSFFIPLPPSRGDEIPDNRIAGSKLSTTNSKLSHRPTPSKRDKIPDKYF